MGTAVAASSPRTKGDEVKLMFELFDQDHDGQVTKDEMRRVLQTLDSAIWTDAKVDKVFSAFDGNEDEVLQFTEFWGWICGHGGKSTADFKPVLLNQAIERDRVRRAEIDEKNEAAAAKKEAEQEREEQKARRQKERAEGTRWTREEFVQQQMQAGLSKEVAMKLYNTGDEDHDGDIDAKEKLWLAQETAATTKHIRGLYQASAGAQNIDAKGNLDVKGLDNSGMDAVVQAFLAWDKDGNGCINAEELAQVLSALNPKMGIQTVEALCREIDVNRDGSIDLQEFVDWLTGEASKKKKMKKKAKEEQDARLARSLHEKRALEAIELKQQTQFETLQHKQLASFCSRKKLAMTCGTLNAGPNPSNLCQNCNSKHGWLCHGCGFVSFTDECVSGCAPRKFGWSCISGKCEKKKCGCKKKPEIWQKTGNVHGLASLSQSAATMLEAAKQADKDKEQQEQPAAEQQQQ